MEQVIEICAQLIAVLFGSDHELLYALVLLVILDYIVGVCVAIHSRTLSSSIGAKGISKKVVIFLLVSVAHVADQYLMDSNNILRNVVTMFYLTNECISIFENVGRMGIPLPEQMKELLEFLNNKSKK